MCCRMCRVCSGNASPSTFCRICRRSLQRTCRTRQDCIFECCIHKPTRDVVGYVEKHEMATLRIGIDTGGTFTDFIVIRDGRIEMFKELSTPQSPEEAIMKGMARLDAIGPEIIHGSTVATNALLERKGAKTALLTTSGFEDVLVIGRQTRRELYNIFVTRPEPLVPDTLRFGVRERVLFDGAVDQALDVAQLQSIFETLRRER